MKRYYNDEPEPNDFFDPEDDEEEYDDEEEFLRQAMMSEQQGQNDQKMNTLAIAITILSSNWFWRFKSMKTKIQDVSETYLILQKLMST
jgi:hypothetical protein